MSNRLPESGAAAAVPGDVGAGFEWADEDILKDEESGAGSAPQVAPWKVAVVDDDLDVHSATRFALDGVHLLGRPVQLLHATTAELAKRMIAEEGDVAVALVDVVMEEHDTGLRLVRALREAGFGTLRIVLRTGQPGYAPEQQVLQDYDINDYRTKTELSNTRLISVLTTAVRGYEQLSALQQMRLGLEQVVASVADLFSRSTLGRFSCGVLTQVAGLLQVPPQGLVSIAVPGSESAELDAASMEVISGAGRFIGDQGKRLSEVQSDQALAAFSELGGQCSELATDTYLALRFVCRTGRELFVYIETARPITDADLALIRVFSTNIAVTFDNVQLVERLDRLAFVDADLGLPNENAFIRDLDPIHRAAGVDSVALIRLEELETVLSGYGLLRGREYLRELTERLRCVGGPELGLAHIGEGLLAVAFSSDGLSIEAMHRALTAPLLVDEALLPVRATVAVLGLAGAWEGAPEVMRRLRTTMTLARRRHPGGVLRYDAGMHDAIRRRLFLQSALLGCLESGEGFSIVLQPKVELVSGRVVGAEALSRWTLDGEFVSPGEFVPIVEDSGLSRMLRDCVLSRVGTWVRARRQLGHAPLPVAVNLSIADMREPDFAQSLLARVVAEGLGPLDLHLEITESGMMESLSHHQRELTTLREAGYSVAVDDFGTGYSSLSYLEQLPVDTLKIDRSFVQSLGPDSAHRSLAHTTIAMARSLDLEIIAEGVETEAQHQALVMLGCPVGQGYLYSRPVAPEDFPASITRPLH